MLKGLDAIIIDPARRYSRTLGSRDEWGIRVFFVVRKGPRSKARYPPARGCFRGWNREIIIISFSRRNDPSFVIILNPPVDRGIGLKFGEEGGLDKIPI